MAQFYPLKKDWNTAVSEAEIGVALEPNSTAPYSFLGNALIYSSRYEEAVLAYEKSIHLDPFPAINTLIGYANCLRIIGRYEEAVAAFKKLIQWRPDNLLGQMFGHSDTTTGYNCQLIPDIAFNQRIMNLAYHILNK